MLRTFVLFALIGYTTAVTATAVLDLPLPTLMALGAFGFIAGTGLATRGIRRMGRGRAVRSGWASLDDFRWECRSRLVGLREDY